MKIGIDVTCLSMPKTGIGQYQYNLVNSLLKIDKKNEYHPYAFNLRDNSKYHSLNFKVHAHKIPQRLITAWWMGIRWPHLEHITDNCDIYQISEICQQPTKRKTVAFIHDLTTILYPDYHLLKNKILYHFRFKNIKKHADVVLTNSKHTKNDIIQHLGISNDRIVVTPFGVDEMFKPTKGSMIEAPYICYLGTIEPRKNLENLFKAFKRLKDQEAIPHKLVLIGKDGWFYEDIYKVMRELNLENDVVRLGFVPDEELPGLLSGAELFVYPSFYEGFGLPVLEAMACGTPVVTSRVSSLPEVGGEAVKYCNPDSYKDIAEKMFEFLKSWTEREKYSKLGLERAKKFTWENCARKHLNVYQSMI